jgi:hypothetical protein
MIPAFERQLDDALVDDHEHFDDVPEVKCRLGLDRYRRSHSRPRETLP